MQTESLFHTYSQYASKSELDAQPSEEEQKTEEQLNDILEKVRQRTTGLNPCPVTFFFHVQLTPDGPALSPSRPNIPPPRLRAYRLSPEVNEPRQTSGNPATTPHRAIALKVSDSDLSRPRETPLQCAIGRQRLPRTGKPRGRRSRLHA